MWIVVESGELEGKAFEISADGLTVGRDAGCSLTLADRQLSSHHAEFERSDDGQFRLRDLGSTNGTIVDGKRIEGSVVLSGDERVRVGRTQLRVSRRNPASGDTQLAVVPAAAATVTSPAQPLAPPPLARPPAGAGAAGAAGAAIPAPHSPSMIQRVKLQRSVNRAVALAIAAVVVAVVAVGLAVAGVFSGGGSGTPTVAGVVSKVAPSTLLVLAERGGQVAEEGTAWVLDAKQGLIVTNNHVAQGGDTLSVGTGGTPTGTVAMGSHAATIVAAAPCEDIAVLHVNGVQSLPALPLAAQGQLKTGDGVIALGFPVNASLNDNLVATSGIVSVPHTQYSADAAQAIDVPDLSNVIQTTAAINPGNSGGPLVNYKGQLVGMDSAGLDQAGGRTVQGQGYAIGSDRISQIVSQLRNGHSLGWAGFGLDFPDPNQLRSKGLPAGLLVRYTEAGSPASKIPEFQNGTVLITSIDGKPLGTTLKSYCDAVQGVAGRTVPVTVVASDGTQSAVPVPFA